MEKRTTHNSEKSHIRLECQDYIPHHYPQSLSKSFIPDLSVPDMLFNVAPSNLKLIMTKNQKDELLIDFAPN